MIKKEDFFNVYFNLPLEERKNVVAVLDDEPISWSLAYQEIKNQTKKGQNSKTKIIFRTFKYSFLFTT